jgi:hypothetical protein
MTESTLKNTVLAIEGFIKSCQRFFRLLWLRLPLTQHLSFLSLSLSFFCVLGTACMLHRQGAMIVESGGGYK